MFFSFKNKNLDPMLVKKVYYYSPEKLKLIPIQNFIKKLIVILVLMSCIFIGLGIIISQSLFTDSQTKISSEQTKILEDNYKNELKELTHKYLSLAEKFSKLKKSSNSVRLSVNLEPEELNMNNFGLGGSDIDISNNSFLAKNSIRLDNIYKIAHQLENDIKIEFGNYKEIKAKIEENKKFYNHLPAIKPVIAPYGDRYGYRMHPILKQRRMHHGIDFLANIGEKVFAPGDGKVTFVGRKTGYGKVVRINHGYGYETIYAHLSKFNVKKNQKVKRGDIIAYTGNTGKLSTGPHLHYEVRHNARTLNPRNFIFDDLNLFDIKEKKYLSLK